MANYVTMTDLASGDFIPLAEFANIKTNMDFLSNGQLPDPPYDSGWFATPGDGNTATKAHSLSTTPAIVVLEHATTATPGAADEVVFVSAVDEGGGALKGCVGYDGTNIYITQGASGSQTAAASTRRASATGYWRVYAWDADALEAVTDTGVGAVETVTDWDVLTNNFGDLDAGEVPQWSHRTAVFAVTTNTTYTKAHGLDAEPQFATIEHADVASPGGGDEMVVVSRARSSGDARQQVMGIDGTNLYAQTNVHGTQGTCSSTRRISASGYYRMTAWITGEYPAGTAVNLKDPITLSYVRSYEMMCDLMAEGALPEPAYDSYYFAVTGNPGNTYTKAHGLGERPHLPFMLHSAVVTPGDSDEKVLVAASDAADSDVVDVAGYDETNFYFKSGGSGGDSTSRNTRRDSEVGYWRGFGWKL